MKLYKYRAEPQEMNGGMKSVEHIKKKNEARYKWLQQNIRASQEAYKMRIEANVPIRRKKNAWMNNKISQIEYNHKRNDARKFFQEIKTFKPQQSTLPTTCKGTSGNTISQIDELLARWKEYFQNLLSVSIIPERQQQINERTDNHDEIAPPAYNEICTIINKLKTNKAAGTDNITAELINMAEEPESENT